MTSPTATLLEICRSSRSRSPAKVGGGAPCRCRSRSSTASIATLARCENLCSVVKAWIHPRQLHYGSRLGGEPVTAKSLTKRFVHACGLAGIRATFHSLRHTYAIFMLATLTRRLRHEGDGHINAVKTLQLLLGHASLHTTSTYLNAVRLDPQLLSGSINDLYQTLQ